MPIVGILAPLFKVTHFLSEFIFCPFFCGGFGNIRVWDQTESLRLLWVYIHITLFCVHVYIFWVHIYINGLSDLLNLCMGGQFSNEKIGLSTFLIKITRKIVKEKCWWNFDILFSKEKRSWGTVECADTQNSKLPTWLGCFGCQEAAGYPKIQFLSYVVNIFPTYPVK